MEACTGRSGSCRSVACIGEIFTRLFLSQQSLEKAMKALWLYVDGDPWRHSIQKLVMQFPRPEMLSDVQQWVEYAGLLDRFYTPTRYPNGLPDLTPGQVYVANDSLQAIEKASFFLEETRKLMRN